MEGSTSGRYRTFVRIPAIAAVLLVAYWLVAAVVIAVDPFDIYNWGTPVHVDSRNVSDDTKQLIAAIARDPTIDLLMVGASTSMAYTPDQLRRVFPGATNPFNLSYRGVRPADRKVVLDQVIAHSRARRAIIWFDWAYGLPTSVQVEDFPTYMYDDNPLNDLRMVNLSAIQSLWWRGRNIPQFPDFADRIAATESDYLADYRRFHSRRGMDELSRLVRQFRPTVGSKGARGCGDLPALSRELIPQLREMDSKGWKIDVVVPAYSPALYYSLGAQVSGLGLGDQLLLRRCLVLGTARLANVRVLALDADEALTGNIRNYKDPGHLFGAAAQNQALDDIAHGQFLITTGNLDAYLTLLRKRVLEFRRP